MKMLLGFFIGTTVGLLAVLIIFHNSPSVAADSKAVAYSPGSAVAAAAADDTTTITATTLPDGTDLGGMMPDVKKIYFNALGQPYRQVESEITDPDIARFFRSYMDATGLDKAGLDQ
jgi:RecA-family ATPase